jgi:orotate phosphoribosyltransferase
MPTMNSNMNNGLYHADELISAFSTSAKPVPSEHLSDDEFIRYANGTCNPVEDEAIDAHLAVCRDCACRMEHLVEQSSPWTVTDGQHRLAELSRSILNKVLEQHAAALLPNDYSTHDRNGTKSGLRLRTPDELEIITLLHELEVIERSYDYVLPSGLHSDTYVNTGKLCQSEEGMRSVAQAFDALFSDVDFDVIVCNGWAMGMIARRVARERALQSGKVARVVIAEGYASPAFSEDLAGGLRALVLIDVSITGKLMTRLVDGVHRYGATVVGTGSIATPSHTSSENTNLRALAAVDMVLDDTSRASCPRCAVMRKLVFNPISSQMTVKKLVPRSPTEFLAEFPEAIAFWEMINTTRAYEHHHVEDNTHYFAFVNTATILNHPTVGSDIVGQLLDLVIANSLRPTVILIPNRSRARLLAAKFVDRIATRLNTHPTLVYAHRRHAPWAVDEAMQHCLQRADVLVLDTATGHGSVLDELSLIATDAGAHSVSAAVILSRLTLSCEDAFRQRLAGRFYRLFHLPIRPVAIRSNDRTLCPVCHQRDLIKQAAAEQDARALRELAQLNANQRKRPKNTELVNTESDRFSQRLLFDVPPPPLLQRCRRAVASGITLHALHTAMTDGMAPLALPELRNPEIPCSNRVAMLEHLPPGIFEWSEAYLDQSMEDVLADGGEESIWLASADILAREGRTYWVAYLKAFLKRSSELQTKPREMFWNRLAYGAFRLAAEDADVREEIASVIAELQEDYRETVAAEGLGRVIDVLADQRECVTAGEEDPV